MRRGRGFLFLCAGMAIPSQIGGTQRYVCIYIYGCTGVLYNLCRSSVKLLGDIPPASCYPLKQTDPVCILSLCTEAYIFMTGVICTPLDAQNERHRVSVWNARNKQDDCHYNHFVMCRQSKKFPAQDMRNRCFKIQILDENVQLNKLR